MATTPNKSTTPKKPAAKKRTVKKVAEAVAIPTTEEKMMQTFHRAQAMAKRVYPESTFDFVEHATQMRRGIITMMNLYNLGLLQGMDLLMETAQPYLNRAALLYVGLHTDEQMVEANAVTLGFADTIGMTLSPRAPLTRSPHDVQERASQVRQAIGASAAMPLSAQDLKNYYTTAYFASVPLGWFGQDADIARGPGHLGHFLSNGLPGLFTGYSSTQEQLAEEVHPSLASNPQWALCHSILTYLTECEKTAGFAPEAEHVSANDSQQFIQGLIKVFGIL